MANNPLEIPLTGIHIKAYRPTDRPGQYSYQSITYDEAEFNDGSTNLQAVVDDLIDEGNTKIIIELTVEE